MKLSAKLAPAPKCHIAVTSSDQELKLLKINFLDKYIALTMRSHYFNGESIKSQGKLLVPNPLLTAESSLTNRYQTTVPEPIRNALKLKKRERIHYEVNADGTVAMSRAEYLETDPVLDSFLQFSEKDMSENPKNVQSINSQQVARIGALVEDVEVYLNQPLAPEDD